MARVSGYDEALSVSSSLSTGLVPRWSLDSYSVIFIMLLHDAVVETTWIQYKSHLGKQDHVKPNPTMGLKYFAVVLVAYLYLPLAWSHEWKVDEAFIVQADHRQQQYNEKHHPSKIVKTGAEAPAPVSSVPAEGIQETTPSGSEDAATTYPNNESYNQEAISSGVPQLPIPDGKQIYPWLVSVMKDGKQACTATLIDNRHVLTTAFCIFNFTSEDLAEIEVQIGFQTAGANKLRQFELSEQPYVTGKVAKAIRHLRFNPMTAFNDVGLLQLLSPVEFSEFVQPIQLTEDAALYDNQTLEQSLIGWRFASDLEGDTTLFWRDQPIKYRSIEECRKNYEEHLSPQGISDTMICRGGDTSATSCNWRFGAPLIIKEAGAENATVVKGTQLGIFSWGVEALVPECLFSEESPTPLVLTRVASYYQWIRTNLLHV